MSDLTVEADKLRREAADLLNRLLGTPDSGATARIVDCIVSAAVLEVAEGQKQAVEQSHAKKAE